MSLIHQTIVPSRAGKKHQKKKSTKKKPHVRGKRVKKELKKDQKKLQNRMKNATIEIVAGHSEQNEPVFVCVGREYRIFFCVSTDSYAKKQKKLKIGHVNGILLTKEHACIDFV